MALQNDFPKEGLPVLGDDFRLFLSPDNLLVYLEPTLEKRDITPSEYETLIAILKEKGVVYGILKEPVWEGEKLILAKGRLPEDGKDARLKWLVNIEQIKKPFDEDAEQIDFREKKNFLCVHYGQEIAEKILATEGLPGVNVFGQELPARSGKDITIKTNEHVGFDEKTNTFYAKQSGVLKVLPGRIEIHPELTIQGDVDWDVGNIRFYGEKLTITGDVKRGFSVLVEGNLEILGNVEDETKVQVYGDLLIEGLVIGEKTKIFCTGQARLGAVEYANLEIQKDLVITDYLLGTHTIVGGDLIVTEGIGAIIGGETYVKGKIIARILGSRAHVETNIKAGYDILLFKEMERVTEDLLNLEKEKIPLLEGLKKGLALLKTKKLSREQIKKLEALKKSLETLLEKEVPLKKKQEELRSKIKDLAKKAEISGTEQVFAGVKLSLGTKKLSINENQKGAKFLLKEGKIVAIDK
ncbi:DUF342 domain-containing protein [Thermodesulfatator atlanticus]